MGSVVKLESFQAVFTILLPFLSELVHLRMTVMDLVLSYFVHKIYLTLPTTWE